jgi:hypothetical protein
MRKSNIRLCGKMAAMCLHAAVYLACTQVDKNMGSEIVPPSQLQPIVVDTITEAVSLTNIMLDSIETSYFSTAAIGKYRDNRFGIVQAGFAAQFEPQTYANSTYFDGIDMESVVFDSLVLTIKFSGTFYGKNEDNPEVADSMNIEVYELTTALDDSANYYGSFKTGSANPVSNYIDAERNIAQSKIAPSDTMIAITLNARDLLEKLQRSIKVGTLTKEEFIKDYFKGLYITASSSSGNGCIKYTNPVISASSTELTTALWAYYHRSITADSAVYGVFAYLIGSSMPRFNVYEHSMDAYGGDSIVVLQGLYGRGIEAAIDAQTARKWQDKPVNRVELVLEIAENERTIPELNMFPSALTGIYKKNGSYSVIRDVSVNTFDGTINRSSMRYSLNITHFFRDVSKGSADVLIIAPATFYSALTFGVIKRKPLLRITYSNFMTE